MTGNASTAANAPRPAFARFRGDELRRGRLDPRLYQIAMLGGAARLRDDPARLRDRRRRGRPLMLAAALLTQYACTRLWKLPAFDPRSALISGPVAVPAAADEFARPRDRGRRHHHRQQVRHPPQRQAPLQPDQLRHRRDDAAHRSGLGVARAVGQRRVLRVSDGLPRRARRQSRGPERRDLRLHRVLHGARLRPLALARRADDAFRSIGCENGALLLFTFFMISDPRTTPNSRAGRILFALLVACGAWYVQFRLFRTNGLLWSLALFSMTVPLIDWLLPGTRYEWARPRTNQEAFQPADEVDTMKRLTLIVAVADRSRVAWSGPGARSPSAASTSPRRTPSCSTRRRRSSSCGRTTGPC